MKPLTLSCLLASAALAAGCDHSSAPAQAQKSTSSAAPALQAVQGPLGPVPGAGDAAHPDNPHAGDPQALSDGRRLFTQYNCAGCHGDHAGGGMGPSLRDVDWIYGSQADDIYDSIAQGRANGMPAWGTLLTQDQVWTLVAYVKSLRTPREPQPPAQ